MKWISASIIVALSLACTAHSESHYERQAREIKTEACDQHITLEDKDVAYAQTTGQAGGTNTDWYLKSSKGQSQITLMQRTHVSTMYWCRSAIVGSQNPQWETPYGTYPIALLVPARRCAAAKIGATRPIGISYFEKDFVEADFRMRVECAPLDEYSAAHPTKP